MTAHINAGGWKSIVSLYVKVGTTLGPFSNGWRAVSNGYVNAGGWKSFFTSTPTPSIVSAVTISRNNAAYPSTLTGTNRFWTNSTSLTYVFQKSSDGTNWSDIGSPAVITNPSSGSTNTKTYVLTTADMPAYTSYYRFSVTAVNSTYSTTKTSNSTSVTVTQPAPVNAIAPLVTPSTGTPGVTTYSTTNGDWDIDDADGIYAYQWQYLSGNPQNLASAGEVARGSTSASYSPPSNYVTLYGSSLRCVVTATNTGGLSASMPTSNVATVSPPPIIPAGSVSVSGSLTLNSVLTCSVANVTGGASYTYQWYYGFSGVANTVQMGATSSTLTLLSGDIPNQYFKCIVVATSSTGNTTTFTSNIVGPTYSAPAQVTGVTATVTSIGRAYNDGEIGVSWTAPANNGSAITGYLVQSSSNGGSSWTTFASNWTSGTGFGSSPWGVGTYIFRVAAINAAGTGTFSANSNNAVVTTVPQAPTIGTATAGNGTVSVAFTAGATGGSAITGYTVTSSSGNTGTGTSSPISVSDTNGTARTYTVTATNANGTSVASSASNSATPAAPVSPPANTSQPTLSGNLSVGSTLTFGVGSWSGSPTSYDLRLYRGTQFVATSETLAKNAGNVTSSTYVITQADFDSAQKYFRAFASATNAGGTSSSGALTAGQELGPITAAAAPATAPGIPGTPTNGWTSGTSYPFSWTAATPGTVSGGGAATISSYQIKIYEATSNTGTGATLLTTLTSVGSGTTYTYTSPNAALYYAASVSATNSAGLPSSAYSGISAYK